TVSVVQKLVADKGLSFDVGPRPDSEAIKLKPVRIGLWDQYGGSMPSGWIRWLFEQYEFPFEVVYPKALDARNRTSRFDVLVFVSGAIPPVPATNSGRQEAGEAREAALPGGAGRGGSAPPAGDTGQTTTAQPNADSIPAEFRDRLGSISIANTLPQ